LAVRIKFDSSHNVVEPTFVLSTRTGDKLGPIPAVEISVSDDFNDAFKLEFKVYKYNNGVKCELWERITDFALVWCREWDVWFEISVTLNDNNATVKSISGVSLGEAELSQIVLYEFEANTEDDIARDDYKPTVLYDEDDAESSLLDRMMEKVPHYTIAHVDTHIQSLQRTFTFDNTSILDAFNDIAEEIDCIFVIDSGTNDDGEIARSIYVYDLQSYCIDCTHRDSFQGACPECGSTNILQGYGDDTSIFVSTENLAEDIQLEVDTGSVKNCFRLEAGDDLMTAAIRSCNPNGSQYIWYISDDVKRDMPHELVDKLEDYDELYDEYVNTRSVSLDSSAVSAYNTLINKYVTYRNTLATVTNPITGYSNLMNVYYDIIDFRLFLSDEFMPTVQMSSTTAAAQAALITSGTMSPVAVQNISTASLSTCSSSALAMAKTLVRPNYQVKVNDGATYSNNVWTGSFKVTNYSDDTDTANSASISITITGNYENFVLQRIQKLLSEQDDNYDPTTVSEVFKLTYVNFVQKLKDYGLATLQIFHDCGQSVLDVLLQLGVANDTTWADQNPDLYNEIYLPYYNKLEAIDAEIIVRESEIDTIDALKKSVETNRNTIQDALNFQEYLGTELWLDFSTYRREDSYSNSNFVSDGLTNTEIFDLAREFIKDAEKDIYKSATLQHSITATLKNLLAMKEFAPILDYFKVGNWIRARVDDVIYRLRLLSYSIEFDSPDDITIEFSDVQRCINGFDDTLSVLDSASSMASSYDFVTRQAKKGYNGNEKLAHWVEDGLTMTKMKIIDNADYQNMQWDEHGMLFREYLPLTDDYSDKQLKIINRGLYVTDDNWRTSKVGIGDFVYYDPEIDQNVEAYGLIADTIVGKIILGEEVGIYNTEGSVTIDKDGMKICADLTYDGTTDTMFKIQRKVTDNTTELGYKIEDLLYLDTDGDLVVNGTLSVYTGGNGGSTTTLNDFQTSSDVDSAINAANSLLEQSVKTYSDGKLSDATNLLNVNITSATTNLETRLTNNISQASNNIVNDMTQIIDDKLYSLTGSDGSGSISQMIADSADALREYTELRLSEELRPVDAYMEMTDQGLKIGADNSSFYTLITNSSMEFCQNNEIVAYISDQHLYINNATINDRLRVGNYFFSSNSDDGMTIVWISD